MVAVAGGSPIKADDSPAPTNSAQLQVRVQQLKDYYAPYLQSLPQTLNVRTQADLSGAWLSRFEVDNFTNSPAPQAPAWYAPDLDVSSWTNTTVPEWRYDASAPTGTNPDPNARPNSRILWYRTSFAAAKPQSNQRVFLVFAGVDWEAQVWLNGTFLGDHTAYWEPFRFDVTSVLSATNVLAVRVLAGPKLGEPVFGWTLFPCALAVQPRYVRDAAQSVVGQRTPFGFLSSCFLSGIGIHREVLLETTGPATVSGLFVHGDPSAGAASIQVETDSTADHPLAFDVQLLPENFAGGPCYTNTGYTVPQGASKQTVTMAMANARLWQPTAPCLYRCRVVIRDGAQTVDAQDVLFGYRSFGMVQAGDSHPGLPAGMFLLNDQPVFLRGACNSPALNAFWYWHQDDKLLDAVLMMKAANFNALRASEHVQFREVREQLDRLGMLVEQDMCGAGNSSYPTPMNTITNLMARLARESYNNPGVVLLTAGEETTMDPSDIVTAVLAVDPARILKPVSGNMRDWSSAYELPPGYPALGSAYWPHVVDDFHCYNGWYPPGADMWKLSRIYPPGRMVTCSEFGAEALDAYATMQQYPALLQPPPITANSLWGAVQVQVGSAKMIEGQRGQTASTLGDYITASQKYQADVLAEQASGLRLSPQRIGGYFMFHFIDALPVEWPKSIVSFDLSPKPGFFAMAQVNQPVAPLFQISNQGASMKLWVANDLSNAWSNSHIAWSVEAGGTILLQGQRQADVQPYGATPVTTVDLSAIVQANPVVTIALALSDASGNPVSSYRREVFLAAWELSPKEPGLLLSDYPFDGNATNLVDATAGGTEHGNFRYVAGKIGSGAIEFFGGTGGYEGTNPATGYVDLTPNGYPNATAGRATGSATFWMKSRGAASYEAIIGSNQGGFPMFEINLQGNTGKLDLWTRAASGSFTPLSAAGAFNDGNWHQVTVAWNATTGAAGSGSVAFYIDGALNSSAAGDGGTWTSSDVAALTAWSGSVRIGCAESGDYFLGTLDDVAIWSNKLSATEAKAIYNLGNNATLNYDARNIATLFTIFAGGPGTTNRTSEGRTWQYVAGLAGSPGDLVNGGTAVILDGSGNGVGLAAGGNLPPTVSVTQPTNGAAFTVPASVVITATASDADGAVTNVAFYEGSTLLGQTTNSPYRVTWTNVAAGNYALTARAWDNGGASSVSAVANIRVSAAYVAPALLSDYPFDTNANDIVNGINGALHGSATITNDGAIGGGSLKLDGTVNGNYVDITAGAYPNNMAGRAIGSATFWMKGGNGKNPSNAAGQYNCIMGFNGSGYSMFEINSQGDASKVDLWTRALSGPSSYTPRSAAGAFQDGGWHQVTVTWNATTGAAGTGNAVFYIDGVLNGSDNGLGSTWTSNTTLAAWGASMTIGTAEQSTSGYTGQLDDVAVWGNQLTAAQASAMYHAGKDLQYNAKDIASLFAVFAGGQGSMTNTSDRKKWVYAIGLTGSAGAVVKNFTALVLDGAGNGVRILSAGTTIEVK